jgi:phage gp36-like protein
LYDDQDVERVDTLYAQAIAYLKLVALGKVAIAPDINGVIEVETVHSVVFNTSQSVFGRENDY